MFERLLRFVVSRPRFVIAVTLVLVAGLGWNLQKLEIDPSIRNMLPQDLPEWVNLKEFEETFGASDLLLISVKTEDLLEPGTVATLYGLHQGLEEIDGVSRVLSIFEMKYLEARDGSFKPVDLLDPDAPPETPEERAEAIRRIKSETLFAGTIVSDDLKYCSFIVLPEEDFEDEAITSAVQGAVDAAGVSGAVIVGLPKTRISVTEGMQGDMKIFLPLGIVLMIVLLVVSFWSWLGAILPLLVVVLSVISTFGLLALIGEKVRFVTIIMPVMLIAIANDYGIHLVSHYLGQVGRDPDADAKVSALLATRALTIPVLAAGLTTVAGFLTLTTHVIPSAKVLGVISAFGIVAAFVMTLTFIPAMLSILPKPPGAVDRFRHGPLTRVLDGFATLLRRHGVKLTLALVVIGAASLAGIPRIVVDTDPLHYFHEGDPLRKANEHVNAVFGGSVQMNVVVDGDIKDPEVLARMEEVGAFLEKQPLVSQVTSIVQPIKRMNQAFHGNDEAEFRLPTRRAVVGDFLLLYSMGADPSDFDHMVEFDYTKAQIAARVTSTSSTKQRQLVVDTQDYIKAHQDPALFPVVTGFVSVLGVLVDLIVRGQVLSLGVSLFLVMLITTILFRSFVAGIMVTFPLISAMLSVFGLMGFMEIELNVATVMLSSILIGVGVDYTIHFLWHFREHLAQEDDPWEAVRQTLHGSGRGIIVNALSVIVGFSVMLFSNFMPIFFFGFLLTVSIASCLIAAIILLPVISILVKPRFLFGEAQQAFLMAKVAALPAPSFDASPPPAWMRAVTRLCALAGAAAILWAIWFVGAKLVGFYGPLDDGTWWTATLDVLRRNWGIALAVYVMISLNAAGIAEFKFRRPFALAFAMALPMTPPLMLALWGRRGVAKSG
jgi:hydrophobe/amphiphile efflux-3 (HAE3) family protein